MIAIPLIFLLGAVIFSPLPAWVKVIAVLIFLAVALRRRP